MRKLLGGTGGFSTSMETALLNGGTSPYWNMTVAITSINVSGLDTFDYVSVLEPFRNGR
jgi:hypothetical protein